MAEVLYINASPLGERSHCTAVAEAFIQAYREKNPRDTLATLDLHAVELPPFNAQAVDGKWAVASGKAAPAEARRLWSEVEQVIARFKAADKYVLAVPMWNFGIPYVLKHYLDVIVQPRLTFRVTPEGAYEGLLKGKKAFLALARGGDYSAGSGLEALDHQKPYLELILGFMGIQDLSAAVIEGTAGKDASERKRRALEEARRLAAEF